MCVGVCVWWARERERTLLDALHGRDLVVVPLLAEEREAVQDDRNHPDEQYHDEEDEHVRHVEHLYQLRRRPKDLHSSSVRRCVRDRTNPAEDTGLKKDRHTQTHDRVSASHAVTCKYLPRQRARAPQRDLT
jgi:hypothetical protein